MTLIAGVIHAGKVWLGGDSLLSGDDGSFITLAEPKVWTRCDGRVVMGVAGDTRFAAIMEHVIPLARMPKSKAEVERWIHVDLADEIRQAIKADEGVYNYRDEHNAAQAIALVGVYGKLFSIMSDLSAYRSTADHAAIGCGVDAALTSLRDTRHATPRGRLKRALEAAEAVAINVRKPFNYVNTK
jgi:ATP-dependent protease HslVU (ClpYQ) peptidase subunit